jgi:hypothetical protein
MLTTLRHTVDDEWEEAVAWRGSDESLRPAWPACGLPNSHSRWKADRWCRIVLGVLYRIPDKIEDPYNAVLGVGLWIVGYGAHPSDHDWQRWIEANKRAVDAIAEVLTNTSAATALPAPDAATYSQTDLARMAGCSEDTVRRIRGEATLSPGARGKVRHYNSAELAALVAAAGKCKKWHKHAAAWRQCITQSSK